MAKLWKRSHHLAKPHKIEEVDPHSLSITAPTVIFLSGIMTIDSRPDNMSESLSEIEALLKTHHARGVKPELYGLTHENLKNIFNIAAYNARPDRASSKAAKEMARAVLMPLVTDKQGKPLPLADAQRNLRNLTLVGYSAGTVFAQEMYNAARDMMEQAGFAKADAKAALSEVVLISMAAVSRPLQEKERFTTLYLTATNDLAVRLKNRIWTPLRNLFGKRTRSLLIEPVSKNSLLITAAIPQKKMWHFEQDDEGTLVKRFISPLLPDWMRISSNHEIPHYTTCDDGHNAFSKIVLHGLVNAINRTTRTDVMRLLEPLPTLGPDQKNAYRSRIAKAIIPPA
ncbi:MAG: hypothetical protein GC185_13250 [Alphaproteobacteria bacterium]|nr:hypothetical protein [Alphaproteobacteria bacterium]